MKKLIKTNFDILTLFLLLAITSNAHGLDPAISAKYPFILLNDDHGIITKDELADTTYGLTLEPFSNTSSDTYWKCYRTEGVNINYRVMEYSREWGEYVANFYIDVTDENGVVNQYGMRRGIGVSYCKETAEVWKNLMADQEYVCLNGTHLSEDIKLYNEFRVIGWIFNKLKTKNGCNNYYSSHDCTGKIITQ